MKGTYIDLIKSLTESCKVKILTSFFFFLLSLIIAFDFRGSQTEMISPILKSLVPISYAVVVVSLIWFLFEAVWKQLPEQKFASRYQEIHSCLGKIHEYLHFEDPGLSTVNHLEANASFMVITNMLKKRFGIIAYPVISKDEEVREYFLRCASFLIKMLEYAETGDLKGAKEFSKISIDS